MSAEKQVKTDNNNSNKTKKRKSSKYLSPIELSSFFEQIHMYLNSGISTWEGLLLMAENETNKRYSILLNKIFDAFSSGASFSSAIESTYRFPDYAIEMIKIGEETGRMQEITQALHVYYRDRDNLAQSIKMSFTYPVFMAMMVFAVIIILITQVMPVFEQVFAQLGVGLNPIFDMLLSAGAWLENSVDMLLTLFLLVVLIVLVLVFSSPGKRLLRDLFDSSIFTRKLARDEAANRFSISMSLMLATGMDLVRALDFTEIISGSKKARTKIKFIKDELNKGKEFSKILVDSKIYSQSYNSMITAGLRCGSPSEMLMSIAQQLSRETYQGIQKSLSFVEPILLAFLCAIVGMVMLAVILPLMGILAGM